MHKSQLLLRVLAVLFAVATLPFALVTLTTASSTWFHPVCATPVPPSLALNGGLHLAHSHFSALTNSRVTMLILRIHSAPRGTLVLGVGWHC